MPLITRSALMSRAVRTAVTIAAGGSRVVNSTHFSAITTNAGGIAGKLFNGAKIVTGFLWGIVKAGLGIAGFSISAIWGMIVQATQFIYNFDWNITDANLDKSVQGAYTALYGLTGGLVGSTIGYLACGIVPGVTLFAFNELAGAYVLKEVAQQMGDEILGQIRMVMVAGFQAVARQVWAETYKNFRKFEKRKGSLARKIFGNTRVDNWGKKGQPVLSFAKAQESYLDSIKDPKSRAFQEELIEEMGDSCIEAGYVAANAMDSYISIRNLARTHILGGHHTIQLTPNRQAPDEALVLAGRQQNLQPLIVQTITTHQVLGNRDLGLLVGQDLNEALRGRAPTIRVLITFYNRQTPPFQIRSAGNPPKRVSYTINDVERSKLKWDVIKAACGGANGYLWGRFRATANLDNNRQMAVHGATEQEAENRLRALATLSSAQIVTLSITEERRIGRRAAGQPMQQQSVRVYPAFFTVTNNVQVPPSSGGRATLSGNRRASKAKIELWHTAKPVDADQRIADVLHIPAGVTVP